MAKRFEVSRLHDDPRRGHRHQFNLNPTEENVRYFTDMVRQQHDSLGKPGLAYKFDFIMTMRCNGAFLTGLSFNHDSLCLELSTDEEKEVSLEVLR